MPWRIRKRILKLLARHVPGNVLRVALLRRAGYRLGQRVYVGEDLIIIDELEDKGQVIMGDCVSVAPRVTLVASSYPNYSRIRDYAPVGRGPVTLESDAWLGTGVIVLPNVRIGEGAVVGAGSVVTHDIPAYSVAVGSPARVVRPLRVARTECGESAARARGSDGM